MFKNDPILPLQIYLYGTSGCHLCDDALLQLQPFVDAKICYVKEIDIISNPQIYAQYELMIPVLYNPRTNDELPWPFNGPEVQLWLQNAIQQLQGVR